jgi:Ca-activated chloride channel family protein
MRPTPRSALLLLVPATLTACGGLARSPRYHTAGAVAAYDSAGGETYAPIAENRLVAVADAPRSTFAIDVDTASMSNVRRFLEDGALPPADAVRVEEMINYYDYAYPDPEAGPFTVVTEVGPSPFHPGRTLLHIGLQGKRMEEQELPPRNLVFLIDTSGSMMSPDKLPLVKQSLGLLVEQLDARDRVGIVAYAGSVGVVLEPTTGDQKDTILGAIANLEAGGSTAGAAGIQAAYALAHEHLDRAAINRVILVTDGDFNVGVSDEDELVKMIEQQRDGGVALTVLGFGTGNLADSRMEKLADHGNGNYGYIDDLAEAKKLLVEEAGGTLVTIAKDVKIQVELDPAQVDSYRLVGYENRLLADEDFRNDAKDAGELGAGHSVTAIYELVPAKTATRGAAVATVRLRWQPPAGGEATELVTEAVDTGAALASTTHDFRFAAAVAGFGMLLRKSEHAGESTWVAMRDLALGAAEADPSGRRLQLATLIETAARLAGADLGPRVAR